MWAFELAGTPNPLEAYPSRTSFHELKPLPGSTREHSVEQAVDPRGLSGVRLPPFSLALTARVSVQVALVLFTPTLTRIGSATYALNHHRHEAYYIMALKTRVKARRSDLDHTFP